MPARFDGAVPQETDVARIAGVNIPTQKRVVIALQYIHGIGPRFAKEVCKKVGIPEQRARQPADRCRGAADPRDHRPRLRRWKAICGAKSR